MRSSLFHNTEITWVHFKLLLRWLWLMETPTTATMSHLVSPPTEILVQCNILKYTQKILCTLFILMPLFCIGQKYPSAEIPENLKKNAVAVVRKDQQVFTIINKGQGILKVNKVITILNEEGDKYGMVSIGYDDLISVKSITGRLYNALGKEIRKLKKTDLTDVSAISSISVYEDNRVKYAQLSHYEYPYTVEYSYELKFDGLMFYPSWYPQLNNNVSVQSAKLYVNIPSNLKLRYKAINLNTQPSIHTQDSNVNYSWNVSNLVTYKSEVFSPARELPAIYLAPSTFEIEGYSGNFSSWKEFGLFQNKLNSNQNDLSEETKQEMRTLVASATTTEEKIRRVYNYLQENTRYVSIQLGIGGWKPFSASFVDENKYGDCKALSFYTKALLEAVDISSNYVVVKAGKNVSPLLKDFASGNQFNHVILCVPTEKDTVWLECTNQSNPLGYLGSFTGNRDVLVVTEDGGKVIATPTYNKVHNKNKKLAKVVIGNNGDAEIKLEATYSALQEGSRAYVSEWRLEEQKEWLLENLGFSNVEIASWNMERIKNKIPYVKESIDFKVKSFASISGDRIFFTPNILSPWSYIPPKNDNRRSILKLPPEYDFEKYDEIEFILPKGYRPEAVTEKQAFDSVFGEYSFELSTSLPNHLILKRKFTSNAGGYSPKQYSSFRDFLKKIKKADKSQVVFLKKS